MLNIPETLIPKYSIKKIKTKNVNYTSDRRHNANFSVTTLDERSNECEEEV